MKHLINLFSHYTDINLQSVTDFTHVALQQSDSNDKREYIHSKLSLESRMTEFFDLL